MTQTADANAFLMQSGVKSFKFDQPNTTAKGPIFSLDMQQQRDIKDNSLKFWNDGNPMMQLRVVLQTELRDDDNDDGQRAIYVKGEMQKAVRDAIRNAGASQIEVDGVLAVQYIGDGERTNPAFNPPKLFRAQYQPPVASPTAVAVDDLI